MGKVVFLHRPANASRLALLAAFLLLSCVEPEQSPRERVAATGAALVTSATVQVFGDTYVKSANANANQGGETVVRLQSSGKNRSLVFFAKTAIQQAVGTGTLQSASLELTIDNADNGWGTTGRPITVHRLKQASAEFSATWSCAVDTSVNNSTADCSGATAWNMSSTDPSVQPWLSPATATATILNNQTGTVSFSVTADVAAILAGTWPGHGWLLKKVDETANGTIAFVSREHGPGARLVLQVQTAAGGAGSGGGTMDAGVQSATLLTTADDYIRKGDPNQNFGTNAILRIEASGRNRSIVNFDPNAIHTALGSNGLRRAQLQLTINHTFPNWGPDRLLSAHRMQHDWTELGATWNCAVDSNTTNPVADCSGSTAWSMWAPDLPGQQVAFNEVPTSTAAISSNQTGVVSFDMTHDVACYLAGFVPFNGFLIKKGAEQQSGHIEFNSRETATPPSLVLDYAAGTGVTVTAAQCGAGTLPDGGVPDAGAGCTPTASTDVTCNGVDDDCDGTKDEDFEITVSNCGAGACAATGERSCVNGGVQDSCVPGTPGASDANCDGIDNNCNGQIDEGYTPVATSCGVGACIRAGTSSCVNGTVQSNCTQGAPAASDATCDGVDDNCNGAKDEAYVGASTACGVGACSRTGTSSCVNGVVQSNCTAGAPAASDATCDGIDDNCNGTKDEAYVGVSTTCGVGACSRMGTSSCVSGVVQNNCTPGAAAPSDATCDGIDDNCNATKDEGYVGVSTTCGVGACSRTGTSSCVNGAVQNNCTPGAAAPSDATCDGIDDNCNGQIDEGYVAIATTCGVGACEATGVTSCVAGHMTDSCAPGVAATSDATCNGIDDNCNGQVDEGFPSQHMICGVGRCARVGVTSCNAGVVHDTCAAGAPLATDPTCDNVDDDCDGKADEDFASASTICGVGACGAVGATLCIVGHLVDTCTPGVPLDQDTACDGVDSDCDGSVDEAYAVNSTTCGVGACARVGSSSCEAGTVHSTCTPGAPALNDVTCDGIDDNCNGTKDEGYISVASTCGIGQCQQPGTTSCVGGAVQKNCTPGTPGPNDATCDGIDQNCNGVADEGFVPHCSGSASITCVNGSTVVAECADSDPCNGTESCAEGVCQPGVPQIDDGNPCTTDSCDSSGVHHTPVAAGTSCSDGNVCNGNEACLPVTGCITAPSGAVAWWPGDGNANDIIGGQDGTLTNGLGFASSEVLQGFSYDGVDDVIALSSHAAALNLAGQATLEMWVRIPDDSCRTVFHLRQDATHEQFLQVGNGCTSRLANELVTWTYNNGGTAAAPTSLVGFTTTTRSVLIDPTRFHHLAVTFDGHLTAIFIDGISRAVTVGSGVNNGIWGNFVSPQAADLGGGAGTPANNFSGLLDEVTLYNHALSGAQLLSIFNAGSAGKCKNPTCKPGTPVAAGTACDDGNPCSSNDLCDGAGHCGSGGPAALPDTNCDGVDDDCDGSADEAYASVATTCGTGACVRTGSTACVSAHVVDSCAPGTPSASDTTCDGIDENCNGMADDGYVAVATQCGIGACAAVGTTSCVAGLVVDGCHPGAAAAMDPSCDGVDDDCDGRSDEDYGAATVSCGFGTCVAGGALSCAGGSVQSTCQPKPNCEGDCADGTDNDADGFVDCSDSDCVSLPTCRESLQCADHKDNDEDGLVDCNDPDCYGRTGCVPEVCGNSLDDDGDGLFDCADLDCQGRAPCGDVAADPRTVAPQFDASGPGRFEGQVSFLYTGPDPIQRGVAAGTIAANRVVVVRGNVYKRDGSPLPAVHVTVLNHPEFGLTETSATGEYFMAVNGGGTLTLAFDLAGHIPAQRNVTTPWEDYVVADDVVLVQRDPASATLVDLSNPEGLQVVRGRTETDEDGTRTATLMFRSNVGAMMEMPSGAMVPLPTMTVRLTELTVGPTGEAVMPAPLPPTSAYTYAVDMSADEAEEAGAVNVQFSEPLSFYLENFLGMPVGGIVPAGYFNRAKCGSCGWLPVQDGRVIAILQIADGKAVVDVTGSGLPATTSELTAAGVSSAELTELARLYTPGQTLWHAQIPHFTLYDFNWPKPRPEYPPPPPPEGPGPDDPSDPTKEPCETGSAISCLSRSVGEDIPITGTPFGLHYSSDDTRTQTTLEVNLGGKTDLIDRGLLRIELDLTIDGQFSRLTFPPDQETYTIQWDGRDAFARLAKGTHLADLNLCHIYRNIPYPTPAQFEAADLFDFGRMLSGTDGRSRSPARGGQRLCQKWSQWIRLKASAEGDVADWTFNVHHRYDPTLGMITKGDGRTQSRVPQATFVAGRPGNGVPPNQGYDVQLAALAHGTQPQDPMQITVAFADGLAEGRQTVAAAPDGSVYVLIEMFGVFHVWKVTPGGGATLVFAQETLRNLNGNTPVPPALRFPSTVDGCYVGNPFDLVVAPDGTVYLETGDQAFSQIWRLQNDLSMPVLVAGTCAQSSFATYQDHIPAKQAYLGAWSIPPTYVSNQQAAFGGGANQVSTDPLYPNTSHGLAVGPDCTLYVADRGMVRRVDADGTINTIVGSGPDLQQQNPLGMTPYGEVPASGMLSRDVTFAEISDIAVDHAGNLYIAAPTTSFVGSFYELGAFTSSIYIVEPNGRISLLAGSRNLGPVPAPAAGQAIDAELPVYSLEVDRDDRLLALTAITYGLHYELPFVNAIYSIHGNRLFRVADQLPVEHPFATPSFPYTTTTRHPLPVSSGTPALGFARAVTSMAPMPDGSILALDAGSERLFRVEPTLGRDVSLIASEDGGEVYEFDGRYRHTRTLDALTGATVLSFNYDAGGKLSSITDGSGNMTTVVYGAGGVPDYIEAPFGQRTQLGFDAQQRLTSVSTPTGPYQMTYENRGNAALLATFTRPNQAQSRFSYDADAALEADVNPDGGSKQLSGHRQAVKAGNPVATTAIETSGGRSTQYRKDRLDASWLRTMTAADGTVTTEQIEDSGSDVVSAPDGTITTRDFGPDPTWGSSAPVVTRVSVRTPSGKERLVEISKTVQGGQSADPFSVEQIVTTTKVNGQAWVTTYTGANRTVVSVSPEGRSSSATLDQRGRLVESSTPGLLPVSFSYDQHGRLQTVTQGSGSEARVLTLGYRAEDGYLESAAGPIDTEVASFTPDARGLPLSSIDSGGLETEMSYDAIGDVASIAPPGREAHQFAYTPSGLVSAYTAPASAPGQVPPAFQTAYTLDQDLDVVTLPDGRTIDFQYDPPGKKLSRIATSTAETNFAYESTTGETQTVTRTDTLGTHTLSYAHDGSLLTIETWGGTSGTVQGTVERSYDNNFRVPRILVNGTAVGDIEYDADGLLVSVDRTSTAPFLIARDPQNGAVLGTTLMTNLSTSRSLTPFGELDVQSAQYSGMLLYSEDIVSRDKRGRIRERTETTHVGPGADIAHDYVYQYDASGRLTDVMTDGVDDVNYGYDPNGNRIMRTSALGTIVGHYDGQDKLTRYCPEDTNGSALPVVGLPCQSYTYNASGQLTSKADLATGSGTQFDYDEFGHLRSVQLAGGSVVEYELDARGRRVGKLVNGVKSWGLLYQDSLRPIAQLDGDNHVVAEFVYETASNVPDYMVRDGVKYRFVTDHLGSVRLVVSGHDGSTVQRIDYDEFGQVLRDTNPGLQPFGFAGGLYDADTGLVRFGARDYDAVMGRWTAKDPILFDGGQANLYVYVDGDPVNRIDPSGLRQWSETETRCLLEAGLVDVRESGGLLQAVRDHVFGKYDFILTNSNDTFAVTGYALLLDSQDFGNYVAGYLIGASYGEIGNMIAYAAGNYFAIDEGNPVTWAGIDGDKSWAMIDRGIKDFEASPWRFASPSGDFSSCTCR
jgi:RHS repeat-associated protein